MRLIYILIGWTGGIVLSASADVITTLMWLGLCGLMGIITGLMRNQPKYRIFAVALLACALGGLRYTIVPTESAIAAYNNTGGLTIEGVIVTEPDIRDDRTQLRVRVDQVIRGAEITPSSGLVLVRAPRSIEANYGDTITATGNLITPAEFDLFSYADYLAQQGVFSIMQDTVIQVIEPNTRFSLNNALITLRRDVQHIIAQNLPEPQAGLLTGILVGNERGISPALNEDFQMVGASHIIAISGFNMVIIAGVVMGLLGQFKVDRWPRTIIGLTIIGLYTLFAGANPAVVRAAIMTGVLYVGRSLNRSTYVPASLAFVALVMSFFDPNVLWSISFQLSFFATLSLALFVDPIQRALDTLVKGLFASDSAERISSFFAEPLVVTLAALVFTLPLSVVYFGQLSLWIVPVNLLIVPVQSYLLIIGGVATMTAFVIPAVGQVLYWVNMVILSWTITIVRLFADLPSAATTIYIDGRMIWLYFGVFIAGAMVQATRPRWWLNFTKFMRHRSVTNALFFSTAAILILVFAIYRSRPDGELHVWFLDVGHSNAVLIQTPGGAQMLVDGGRFPSRLLTSIGDRIPFTDREIEVVFITHPDQFDVGALTAVLNRYEIGVAITNGQPNLGDVMTEINTQLSQYDTIVATAGYTLELSDGVRVEVLHPQTTPQLTDNMTDYVLVLRVRYGDVSFLLTSDLSEDGQTTLLEGGAWPLATVLQLPQHGTSRSLEDDFLDVVQPQVVAIQADVANTRGDPNPDILTMLPEDIPIFRTDEGGVIHFWTDGNELWAVQDE